ncbi:MAG TPA: arylsulfatase [Cyclobacteriaceae bacterium]|nr:arylsulfatase [Cyclobacteriaceae bacterium]
MSRLYIIPVLFFLACQGKSGKEADIPPNIIYIMADDLGYGELGCYGQAEIKTPNIDQLAREGMRFTRHYAGTSVCAPSRCVLMTGLHTGHSVVRGNKEAEPYGQFQIPESTITVSGLLKKAGYRTALVGKWGLGVENTMGDPQRQGFDEFYGSYDQVHAHNAFPEYLYRNGQKEYLKNKVQYFPKTHWTRGMGSYATEKVDYSNDLFAEEARIFIRKNRGNPFYLYLSFTAPHINGEAPDGQKCEAPDSAVYGGKDWDRERIFYASSITRMDRQVGSIMDLLRELKIDRNTLVIFTSDNGPEAGMDQFFNGSGILKGHKRDLYEGGIRVPLIAWWPGNIEAGSETAHISGFQDFLPTACDIAGVETPSGIDGISYLPALLGQSQKSHDFLYWEFHEQNNKQAVVLGNWKAVRLNVWDNPEGSIELYDLETDPSEKNNLSDKNPDILSKVAGIMTNAHQTDPEWPLFKSEAAVSK